MTLRKAMGLWCSLLLVQMALVASVHASTDHYSSEAVATFDVFAAISVAIVLVSATLSVVWTRREAKRAGQSTHIKPREGK